MLQIATSVVQLPSEWREDFPDRGPEAESLGHEVIYGDDPEMAEITITDDDSWDDFLCAQHPVDYRVYSS